LTHKKTYQQEQESQWEEVQSENVQRHWILAFAEDQLWTKEIVIFSIQLNGPSDCEREKGLDGATKHKIASN
jgi:hypothetical protein